MCSILVQIILLEEFNHMIIPKENPSFYTENKTVIIVMVNTVTRMMTEAMRNGN